jgi:hypothetical protein
MCRDLGRGKAHLIRHDETVLQDPCLLQDILHLDVVGCPVDLGGGFSKTQQGAFHLHVRVGIVLNRSVPEKLGKQQRVFANPLDGLSRASVSKA